jgi:pimeloyl-ACP methyl ester carboxylesterase
VPVTTKDAVTLWWAPDGAGDPPLLLIQGLGCSSDMWFRVLKGLSAVRRTIRFDNRGIGRSTMTDEPWTLEDMADDALEVLDAADVDRAHVLGISMGGLIAQELALRHPERVAGLILGCTHPGGRDAVRMDPAAATMLMDRSAKSYREAAEASVPFLYATATRDEIEADLTARLRYPMRAAAYWFQLEAIRRHDGTLPRLAQITSPTLVIHGTADRLVQPGNAPLIADAIPGARLEWLDGAGHVFWTDQTERSVALVNGFLAEVERSGADRGEQLG